MELEEENEDRIVKGAQCPVGFLIFYHVELFRCERMLLNNSFSPPRKVEVFVHICLGLEGFQFPNAPRFLVVKGS